MNNLDLDKLEQLAKDLEITIYELDDIVHEYKSAEASSINNGGMNDQLKYLCNGMTQEQAEKFLRDMA